MSRVEHLGFRDGAYSKWHRDIPLELDFIDLDWMELCATCHRIVAIYELARDKGQDHKDAWATRQLAQRANIPGFVVLYRVSGERVTALRVRRVHPDEQSVFTLVTPDVWIAKLRKLRCHEVAETAPELRALPSYYPPAPPRECPSCHQVHSALVTCASVPREIDLLAEARRIFADDLLPEPAA